MSVLYHPGKANIVADTLSRLSMGSVCHVKDSKKKLDQEVHQLARLGVFLVDTDKGDIWVQSSSESSLVFEGRLCVPGVDDIRQQILAEAHGALYSIHPGSIKMHRDLREIYWWSGIKRVIEEFVDKCSICQQVSFDMKVSQKIAFPKNCPQKRKEFPPLFDRDHMPFRYAYFPVKHQLGISVLPTIRARLQTRFLAAAAANLSGDYTGVFLKGQQLKILKALDKKVAHDKELHKAKKKDNDHRNLYLAKGTLAAEGVSVSDMYEHKGFDLDVYLPILLLSGNSSGPDGTTDGAWQGLISLGISTLEMHLRQELPPLYGRDHMAYRSFYFPVKKLQQQGFKRNKEDLHKNVNTNERDTHNKQSRKCKATGDALSVMVNSDEAKYKRVRGDKDEDQLKNRGVKVAISIEVDKQKNKKKGKNLKRSKQELKDNQQATKHSRFGSESFDNAAL
ncbi:hypothetical protein BC332_19004 [Capsicum chinense]|nr:hypothetical protein BC332_19004 [Capsicum chinense]